MIRSKIRGRVLPSHINAGQISRPKFRHPIHYARKGMKAVHAIPDNPTKRPRTGVPQRPQSRHSRNLILIHLPSFIRFYSGQRGQIIFEQIVNPLDRDVRGR